MEFAYDRVAYSGMPRPYTHPSRFFVIGTLLGLEPPPVETCRVLEIGCGDGGNLLPMAWALPQARFLGIDLSRQHIERGRAVCQALGLENLRLEQCDVAAFSVAPGESFDYIIVHGLYSWVPQGIRDAILEVCRRTLAPEGIAMISYNTLPGGHLRRVLRDAMLFHAGAETDPEIRVRKAREMVRSLASANPGAGVYAGPFSPEIARLLESTDDALFHDDLGDFYEPVSLTQFIMHARESGFQFLAEADFHEMTPQGDLGAVLDQLAGDDIVRREQYLDFYVCRKFRATLLCREHLGLDRKLAPHRLLGLYVASAMRPLDQQLDAAAEGVAEFGDAKGRRVRLDLPLGKAALLHLAELRPAPVLFEDLVYESRRLLSPPAEPPAARQEDFEVLGVLLLKLYSAGMVELEAAPARFTLQVSERPEAFPLARLQAARSDTVFNLTHRCVKIEHPLVRQMLGLLDGQHTLGQVREALAAAAGCDVPPEAVKENVEKLARLALLVA